MKKFAAFFLLVISLLVLSACENSDTQTPQPTNPTPTNPDPNPDPTPDPNPPATTVITLTFSASSSDHYTLELVEGANNVATPGLDPELTLKVGQRYRIINKQLFVHPFAFSASETYNISNPLLTDEQTGSFVNSTGVNYVKNDDGFSFTLTSELATELKSYLCTRHPNMFGVVKVTAP
jgi:plastocyanin